MKSLSKRTGREIETMWQQLDRSTVQLNPKYVVTTPAGFRYSLCPPANALFCVADSVMMVRRDGRAIQVETQEAPLKPKPKPRIKRPHHAAKLTKEKAEQIRLLARTGDVTRKTLAKRYGVTESAVNQVVWGMTWV